ncbi:MAG: NADH:flavin oxidoreductase [Myxococcales bacterium]|nr:NADH:flavin oxidoreductase [Myxococcales bacterium]
MLFDEYRFRTGALLKNRVALAPLTNKQSHSDGRCSEAERRWLRRRAEGGFGAIMTCAAHVTSDGQTWDGQLGCFGDELVPGLAKLAEGLRTTGTLPFVQLYHGGARATPRLTHTQPWSASPFDDAAPGFVPPRPARETDLERVIQAFADAARRARDAGFAGVEIHGAHGFLISQFLSGTVNRRTDRWGGSLDNRARLARCVTQAVRSAVSSDFCVGMRLSAEDGGWACGMDLDESLQVARWLAEDGADFVHLSLWDVTRNTSKRPDQHPVTLFRAALPSDVAIVAAGNVWSRTDAENTLARGADVIALGKAAILNPDWPLRAAEPEFEPERGPIEPHALRELAISSPFADYLRTFDGLVTDGR